MIKIGRCYFNASEIAAIEPDRDGASADVFLARGAVISVDVHEEGLQALLEQAGLLQAVDEPVAVLEFTGAELDTMQQALWDGYLYVGKDKSGQVYAYKDMPVKGKSEWEWHGDDAGTRRLHGDFECLSFEDNEPLSLAALFDSGAEKNWRL